MLLLDWLSLTVYLKYQAYHQFEIGNVDSYPDSWQIYDLNRRDLQKVTKPSSSVIVKYVNVLLDIKNDTGDVCRTSALIFSNRVPYKWPLMRCAFSWCGLVP